MPNWLQLVEYTAEFTPNVWVPVITSRGEDGVLESIDIVTIVDDRKVSVAALYGTEIEGRAEFRTPTNDREVIANARLIADAPSMLVLLASALNRHNMREAGLAGVEEADRREADAIRTLLLRHVNLGCAPVDEHNHTVGISVQVGTDVGEYKPHTGEF